MTRTLAQASLKHCKQLAQASLMHCRQLAQASLMHFSAGTATARRAEPGMPHLNERMGKGPEGSSGQGAEVGNVIAPQSGRCGQCPPHPSSDAQRSVYAFHPATKSSTPGPALPCRLVGQFPTGLHAEETHSRNAFRLTRNAQRPGCRV
eukprot:366450-Chlamydomonas_euryale.AAC.29